MTAPCGILPFGSDHPSVLLSNPLTSAAAVTGETQAVGTTSGAGAVFDSVRGFNAGGNGVLAFVTTTQLAALDIAGQMRLEVEKAWLGIDNDAADPEDETAGDLLSADQWALTAYPTGAISPHVSLHIPTAAAGLKAPSHRLHTSDPSAGMKCSTARPGDYVEVVWSWIGSQLTVYLDNVRIATGTNTYTRTFTKIINVWQNIHLGSRRGTSNFMNGHFIRNFQLSNQPVMLATLPGGSVVNWWGDSLANNCLYGNFAPSDTVSGGKWDRSGQWVIRGWFAGRGINLDLNDAATGGYAVEDAHGLPLTDIRAAAIANNPSIIIINAGTNDATFGSFDADTFLIDYKDHIDYLDANCSNLKAIIIGNVPTLQYNSAQNTAQNQANRLVVNAQIATLAAYNTKVILVDTSAILGTDAANYNGGVSGLLDDLHPSITGQGLQAVQIAQAIHFALSNRQ